MQTNKNSLSILDGKNKGYNMTSWLVENKGGK